MKYRKLNALIVSIILIAILATCLSVVQATGALVLTQSSGPAGYSGTASWFDGGFFTTGDLVTLTWDDASHTVIGTSTAVSSNQKMPDTAFTVPAGATSGDHTVTATDQHGHSSTATFTVSISPNNVIPESPFGVIGAVAACFVGMVAYIGKKQFSLRFH